jgi:hypothetical protein
MLNAFVRRPDFNASTPRSLPRRRKDAVQARRPPSLAVIYDGYRLRLTQAKSTSYSARQMPSKADGVFNYTQHRPRLHPGGSLRPRWRWPPPYRQAPFSVVHASPSAAFMCSFNPAITGIPGWSLNCTCNGAWSRTT